MQVLCNGEVRAHFVGRLLVGDVTEGLAKIVTLGCTICRCVLLKQAALVLRNDRFSGLLAFINHDLLAL